MRCLLVPLIAIAATPAAAATKDFGATSFERVRVEGPFEVRIVAGRSPSAKASGDARVLDRLDVSVTGSTLTVRMGGEGWQNLRSDGGGPGVVTLATPRLAAIAISGGGRVTATAMSAPRVDLAVTGAGTLAVSGIDTDQFVAQLVGTGTITAAGRAARARLSANGAGAIDAAALNANDLTVRLEGASDLRAAARYTANVSSTGLGRVVVSGNPKCVVRAPGGAPVQCGNPKPGLPGS